jgi:ABC-type multidrug transport system fused ATPase/permease subunit
MKVLFGIWKLLDARQRRRLVALQVLSLLMAFSTVGGIAAILPFFTVLADPDAIDRNAVLQFLYSMASFDDRRSFVVALGIAFALVVLLANAINLLGSLAMNRFAYQVGNAFHVALFGEYMNRGYGFHARTSSSTLATNVLHETGRVTSGILQNSLILITSLITIAFIFTCIVLVNPLVAVSAVAGLGAGYLSIYVIARGRLLRNGALESRCFAQRAQIVSESFAAIKEISALQAQRLCIDKFSRYCASFAETLASTFTISQIPKHVLECATVFSLAGIALYLSGRGDATGPWIAELSFIGLAAYRLLPALQQAFAAIVKIRADRPAFEHVHADLQQARACTSAAGAVEIDDSWRSRPQCEVRAHYVSFRHTAERPAAISNLSLRVPAGAVVGLIGVNGSGKTTLADLLAGLLVPDSGHIEVDGIVIGDDTRRSWQATIGYVPQQIFLIEGTLAENIALGLPAAQVDRTRVRMAAHLAQLDECIATLPHGYDTKLGERGSTLSGGQRQRLGIARALYRDASVLIMDEATSALDAAAEQEIGDMLMTLRQNRTIILIAHRLSTLRYCDTIYQLEAGRIIRSGPYREFLSPLSALLLSEDENAGKLAGARGHS